MRQKLDQLVYEIENRQTDIGCSLGGAEPTVLGERPPRNLVKVFRLPSPVFCSPSGAGKAAAISDNRDRARDAAGGKPDLWARSSTRPAGIILPSSSSKTRLPDSRVSRGHRQTSRRRPRADAHAHARGKPSTGFQEQRPLGGRCLIWGRHHPGTGSCGLAARSL